MKVLHLSSERTWRGGEQQIAYLILGCINKGIECSVACKRGSSFEHWCITNKIPYYSLGFKNELDIITAQRLKNICLNKKIDIVHTHSSHSQAMAVWSAILGNKTPIVASRRVDFPVKNNFLSNLKFNHPRVKKIISISKKIEEILSPTITNKNKLRVVYSGIDTTRFENSQNNGTLHEFFKLPSTTKLIGNISAIAPHKDYYTFVQTAKQVLATVADVKFIIIGTGPLETEIKDYVTSEGLQDDILFTGFRNDIPEIIQELDIFLMTSKTEGLGTTILDAFANKIPLVCTNAGGIPELIIHGETGLLSKVEDPIDLANNVIRLLSNDSLRETVVKNGYSHLLSNFTLDQMVQGNISVYNEIVKGI